MTCLKFNKKGKRKLNDVSYFKDIRNREKISENKPLNRTKLDPDQESNADRIVVIILLIVSLINVNLVTILGYIVHGESTFFNTDIIEDFSVPCESLSLSADEDYVTFDKKKGDLKTYVDSKGNYICSKKNLTELLQTVNVSLFFL